MKIFDIDWRDFLQRFPTWERLSVTGRRAFAQLKSSNGVDRAEFGEGDVEPLLEAGFVTPFAEAPKVRLHKDCYPFARVIRAMYRHDIPSDPDGETFADYLRENFTNEEKSGLLIGAGNDHNSYQPYGYGGFETALARHAMSARWLESFLDVKTVKQAEQWERDYGPRYGFKGPLLTRAPALEALRAILRHCMKSPSPIPFHDLPGLLPKFSDETLGGGLLAGIQYLLLFPMMTRVDMRPVLGIWPTITARLHRPKPDPPEPVTPDEHFHGAFLMEDMTTVLIAASAEPLRIRGNDYALFARTQRELESNLLSLPDWLVSLDGCTPAQRLYAAIHFLEDKELIRVEGKAGKDLRIERAGGAEDWLGLPAKDRLKTLLDDLKPPEHPKPGKARKKTRAAAGGPYRNPALGLIGELIDEEEEWFDPYYEPGPIRYEFLPQSILGVIDKNRDEPVSTACVRALATLPEEQYVRLGTFLTYQSIEANPLPTLGPNGKPLNIRLGWYRRHQPVDEEMEGLWADWLADLLRVRFLPLGGIRVGLHHTDQKAYDISVALTDVGRYLLRLTDDFDYGHAGDAGGQVILQPNFDVVFLSPAPLAEATISRFAERKGGGLGVLFQITRKSIFTAAGSGMTADQVLDTLREVCAKGVPENVEREIRGWFDRCRHITVEPAVLIRCPDADTAARVLAAGGKKTRPITDTLVELTDTQLNKTLTRKLKDAGIFPNDTSESPRPASRSVRRPRR